MYLEISYDDLVGVASGATGNPAILVYSTKMAPTDRPDIGYAMIFPSMTLVKVIAAQIIGLLMIRGHRRLGADLEFRRGRFAGADTWNNSSGILERSNHQ